MKKKLGPLQTWQWLAIGAAVGVIYYIYRARQAAAGTTPSQAAVQSDLGPIDPTTGQPYALEGAYNQGAAGGGTNQNAGPTSLAQELSDLGSIEGLLAGLGGIVPAAPVGVAGQGPLFLTPDQSAQVAESLGHGNAAATVAARSAGKRAARKVANQGRKIGAGVKHATAPSKANPGHIIKTHPGGKQSAASSHPHNPRQHIVVAPPNHQRAPTTTSDVGGELVPVGVSRPAPRPRRRRRGP